MRKIENLLHHIEEELEDAEHYAECYLMEDDPQLKETFKSLSEQELNHASMLHDHAERFKEEYVAHGHQVPESMMQIYMMEHEESVNLAERIKRLLSM